MSADGRIAQDVARRQATMFAMFVGPGLFTTRAALAAASDLPASTLKAWAAGAAMPLHAVLTLARYLPREAINMLTEPGGMRLVDAVTTDSNWDSVAASCSNLVADICGARADGTVDHVERRALARQLRKVVAEAQSVIDEGDGE